MLTSAITSLAFASIAIAAPMSQLNTAGFQNPKMHNSVGGDSICVSGTVPVEASGKNIKFDIPIPANQTEVTQYVLDFITSGSPFPNDVISGEQTVSGTYNIGATLCFPNTAAPPKRVQIASHGVLFGRNYWDFAPDGYSYVDVATAAGDAIFFYDRLGIGASDHPDPINIVQAGFQLGVLHSLVDMLRAGTIGGCGFETVIGVGHSFGSVLTLAIPAAYPTDFDGLVLTGVSLNLTSVPLFWASNVLRIATENRPARFSDLNNGYLVGESAVTAHETCFHAPGFAEYILEHHERTKQTVTLGEVFSAAAIVLPAFENDFQGPVIVVNGEEDLPFCSGNCTYPSNQLESVAAVYPEVAKGKAQFKTLIVKDAGHGVNLHYTSQKAFEWIQKTLKDVGI